MFLRRVLMMVGACLCAGLCCAQNVFDMPALFPKHCQLLNEVMQAMSRKDYVRGEEIARAAVAIFPNDPNWRYNVACMLARQGRREEAVTELRVAATLGTDLATIECDADLASLRTMDEYKALCEELRVSGRAMIANKTFFSTPRKVLVGQEALVTEEDSTWNWDTRMGGFFKTSFALEGFPVVKGGYSGPQAELINGWLAEGTAAGNAGDLYVNRDEDTSEVNFKGFPGLTPVVYDEPAVLRRCHVMQANGIFDNAGTPLPVVGNSVYSLLQPNIWRSVPRLLQTDGSVAAVASRLAFANQLYVYDVANDRHAEFVGDVLVGCSSLIVMTNVGIAGGPKDQAQVVEVLLAGLAAMRPEVKREMMRRGALVPTMQMLLRRSLMGAPDYLSAAAHPMTFSAKTIDAEAFVGRAHSLTVSQLPLLARLVARQDKMPVQWRDYFDLAPSEGIADTPVGISRIIRGMGYTRSIVVEAAAQNVLGVTYHWFPVNGCKDKIRLKPLTSSGGLMQIEVDYHGIYTNEFGDASVPLRHVDIACVAQKGEAFSQPMYVSFRYLGNEVRTYDAQKRIVSVDYRMPLKNYEDPALSASKDWMDVYQYSDKGLCTGWRRERTGQEPQTFDAQGRHDGKPVKYIPRTQRESASRPLSLLQSE